MAERLPEQKKRKRGPVWKIVLVIVLLLVCACVMFFACNPAIFRNLGALLKGMTTSTETLAGDLEKNKEETVTALKDSGFNISAEDLARAESGEMTEEELQKLLYEAISGTASNPEDTVHAQIDTKDPVTPPSPTTDSDPAPTGEKTTDEKPAATPVPPAQTGKTDDSKPQTPSTGKTNTTDKTGTTDKPVTTDKTGKTSAANDEAYNRAASELVAKVYVLKGQYTGLLSSLEASAKAQYLALPKEERGTAAKAKIVSDNMAYVSGLEAQCDAQIDAILADLTALNKQYGKDDSLVEAIRTAYVNEKELKKAYYVSLYNR